RRERMLAPMIAFAVVSCVIVGRSHLVLNRYALPLAPVIAVLAAHALSAIRGLPLRIALAVALVALQLPATLSYLRLIASEDTRVAAATWLQENLPPEGRVFFPGGPLWSAYVAPDLLRPLQLPKQIEPALAAEIERRLPAPFPRQWRWASGVARPDGTGAAKHPLAAYAGALVITAEHPSPRFTEAMTPPALVQALEESARVLADFDIAGRP